MKMKAKNIIIVSLLLICCFLISGCKNDESKPILRVITSEQAGSTIFTTKRYYVVYDNGKCEKVKKFERNKTVESYAFNPDAEKKSQPYLHNIDVTVEKENQANEIAKKIVQLTKENKGIDSPGKMYFINEKWYFSSYVINSFNTCIPAIFEYDELNDSIKQLVSFSSDIVYVESYTD